MTQWYLSHHVFFPFAPITNYHKVSGLKHHKVQVKITQSCPTFYDPIDYTVHGILQARILEWVAVPFSRGSFQPRDQTQEDSLPAEPPGKSKITGVGSLSLLQQTFLTQKLNQSLLHCRQILYGLSYMVSPSFSDK